MQAYSFLFKLKAFYDNQEILVNYLDDEGEEVRISTQDDYNYAIDVNNFDIKFL